MVDLTGWPTDAGAGSVSTEAKWRLMARLWAPSGVADNYLNQLAPSHGGGNVTVQSGGAWVDGHYCEQLSSQAVAVTSTGLVVIRFTPADNRFQLLFVAGVSTPTQTTATWELPIAQMTGGTMSDVRVFVSSQSVTTSMIKNDAVTAGKLAGNSITAFISSGGDVSNTNFTLTGSYQAVASSGFTKPAGWVSYELTVWGSAAIETGSAETCSIRAGAGGNNGSDRTIEVGGGLHMEVGTRARFLDMTANAPTCTIDVKRDSAGAATVESAVVSWQAIRTT